ncbi:MAG: GtrA family protein [Ruminococcaceae bacterium]|nr:GtrA family protein [Oscillospiraceae bacterium]
MENNAKKTTKEAIMYLVFGVLTTLVSWVVRFGILWPGKALLGIESEEGTTYIVLFTAASIISWVCAVLFAFFTNRAFVFKDADQKANIWVQMAEFFGGRIATFVLFEYLLNLGVVVLLGAILPESMELLTVDLTPYRGAGIELVAMGVASVANIVANYIIGKFLVFRKAKKPTDEA